MTIEQLRKFYDAQPFKPFVMHLADGRAIPVMHREFMASAPSKAHDRRVSARRYRERDRSASCDRS